MCVLLGVGDGCAYLFVKEVHESWLGDVDSCILQPLVKFREVQRLGGVRETRRGEGKRQGERR